MAKILVVDDRAEDREFLVTLLGYARHTVLEAADGAEALALVRTEHPDLVISDVLLPSVDGYEFVRQLRGTPSIAQTKVVFYTALFNEGEARELAKDIGVCRIFPKPTEPKIILDIVAEELGSCESRVIPAQHRQFEDQHRQLLINKLLEKVEELSRSRDELEERVAERTAELKRANLELENKSARLEVLNEGLKDFAFIAAHDLQEPLRKIMTFGKMLKSKCMNSLEKKELEYLDRINQSASRMSGLIHALLDYSRITTRTTPFESVSLVEIALDAASDLELAIERAEATVEIGELPAANVDPVQMRQLFQNLISNAIKYFDYRGTVARPQVKVYGHIKDGECLIFVEDNGIGFEEHYLDRIFKPFQRLHGRNEYKGTGMGLATCSKIIERHGGSITARSVPGEGSTFIVTLPAGDSRES